MINYVGVHRQVLTLFVNTTILVSFSDILRYKKLANDVLSRLENVTSFCENYLPGFTGLTSTLNFIVSREICKCGTIEKFEFR